MKLDYQSTVMSVRCFDQTKSRSYRRFTIFLQRANLTFRAYTRMTVELLRRKMHPMTTTLCGTTFSKTTSCPIYLQLLLPSSMLATFVHVP